MKATISDMQIMEGEVAPWWYGVAYYMADRNCAVFYPIPINIAVRWARRAWWKLRQGKPDELSDAYHRGMRDGRKASEASIESIVQTIVATDRHLT